MVHVEITGSVCIGGLVGGNGGHESRCYSTGTVIGDDFVGGLVGYNEGSITSSYSNCTVSGFGFNTNVGGLVGFWGDNINSSFWDVETSRRPTSVGGTGLTTAEMQMAWTFLEAGWDFVDETENGADDIWWIDEGQDYPRLWWEQKDER